MSALQPSAGIRSHLGILALAAVVVAALAAVALARLSGFEPARPAPGTIADSVDLRFEDTGTGTVLVSDWHSGRLLARLEPGEGSFIRGVLRSLVRERRSLALGSARPFRLSRYRDGRLILQDRATGTRIDLHAFGPANFGAFARLLQAGPLDS